MKRWHEDFRISFREWKEHHRSHVESNKNNGANRIGKSPYEVDCVCDKQIGRFRKKDAWDCGNTRCYICHSDKLMKYKRRAEEKSALKFKEGLKDLE